MKMYLAIMRRESDLKTTKEGWGFYNAVTFDVVGAAFTEVDAKESLGHHMGHIISVEASHVPACDDEGWLEDAANEALRSRETIRDKLLKDAELFSR